MAKKPRSSKASRQTALLRLEPFFVFASALFLRLVYLDAFVHDPFFSFPLVDAHEHYLRALQVLGRFFDADYAFRIFFRAPGYPYWLSVLLALTNRSLFGVYLLQFVAGAALASALFLVARRLWGRAAGWGAAGVIALYGPQLFFESRLLPPVWAELLLVASLICLLPFAGDSPPKGRARFARLVPAALAIGLGALLRPNVLAFALGLALFLGLSVKPRRAGVISALVFLAVVLATLSPVTVENHRREGVFVPIAYGDGVNFYLANGPDHDELLKIRPGRAWNALMDEPKKAVEAEGYSSAFHSAYFKKKALRHMLAHPLQSGGKLLWHFAAHFTPLEVSRDEPVRYHLRRWSGSPILFSFLLPSVLGVTGLFALLLLDRPRGLLLLLPLVAYAAGGALFFFLTRYRMPVAPLFALGTGYFVHLIVAKEWRRPWGKRGARWLLLGLPLALVAFPRLFPAAYDLDRREGEIAEAKIYATEIGDLARAERLLTAIEEPTVEERFWLSMLRLLRDPSPGRALRWAKSLVEKPARAEDRFEAAHNLLLYGYRPAAELLLDSLLDIPEYAAAAGARLGEMLGESERYERCLEVVRLGLAQNANLLGLHEAGARCFAGLEKWDGARFHLDVLMRMQPHNGRHYYHRAVVEHLAGNDRAAAEWMARARELGFAP